MSVSEKALEKRLLKAGKKFLDQPLHSSAERLLQLLDELFLSMEDILQDPPSSMKNVLSPLMKALVGTQLLEHSNNDVKVYVAACISQIMRITAPDAPCDDEKMKEVLQLIVSSFERLFDLSSLSYEKRIHILDIVAKSRIPLVMLDLECDSLLIEMFQHFLKALRDYHPKLVFLSMENIMTLVLEESEDISPELLSPILDYVKKDDEVPQVSRRLAEQVLSNCASKLDTYLTEAVKSSGVSLDKYSHVVASICTTTYEMVAEETETPTHKRTRVEDLQHKRVIKPCSVLDQLAMTSVRQFRSELETKEQSIVETLSSVRQFRSEIKRKEDNLEASLHDVDVLGEKIMGIKKILNS